MIHKILVVALGGSIGAVLRFLIFTFYDKLSNQNFPWATLAVNLIGSFMIGLLWGIFDKIYVTPGIRLFLFVGILGSFTTFSTFAFDVFSMSKEGDIKNIIIYILATNIFGIALAFGGYYLSKLS
ncbi:MAG: fluoride efflux transporter CrcB [Bacteroidota bacterium]